MSDSLDYAVRPVPHWSQIPILKKKIQVLTDIASKCFVKVQRKNTRYTIDDASDDAD